MVKVLVIDSLEDKLPIIQSTINKLFQFGVVLHFKSFQEALPTATKENPDLIFLNIDSSAQDGFLTFQYLKQHQLSRGIFIISEFNNGFESIKEVLNCNADGFIKSPIEPIHLYSQIRATWKAIGGNEFDSVKSVPSNDLVKAELGKNQKNLSQKQNLLNSLLDNTDNGILVVDNHGKILHSNTKFAQLWNIPLELIQKNEDKLLLDFVLNQLENSEEFLYKVNKLYDSYQIDQDVLVFKDGRKFKRISYPLIVSQELQGRVWNFSDITTEQKAQELIQKLNLAVHNSKEVIFMTDKDGVFTFTNPEFTRLYGYTSNEVIGIFTPRILRYDQTPHEIHEQMWRTILARQRFTAQYKNKCKDGRLIQIEVSVDPIVGVSNEIIGFIAFQKDITQRLEAEKSLEKRLRELTSINSSSKKLQKLYTNKSLVKELASILEDILTDGLGEVLLIDEVKQKLVSFSYSKGKFEFVSHENSNIHSNTSAIPLNKGITGWVVKHGQSLCVEDVRKDFRYFPTRKNTISQLCVPLQIGNHTLGVINLESQKSNAYSNNDIHFWETIANQMSVAIQNARLYQSLQDELTKRKRMEKIQSILIRIVNATYTTVNLEDFIRLIREQLAYLIDTTNFYIALYDKESDCFTIPYLADQEVSLKSFPAGKSLTAYVYKTQKSILVDHEKLTSLKDSGEVIPIGKESKIWLGVPIFVNEQTIGVFTVQSYDNANEYSEKDLKLLEFITNQIGVSIGRKKTENDLKMALDKAQESDRLKTAFLETMSHELRTPLNAVIGFSDLIGMENSLPEIHEYASLINQSGQNLLSIVEDILNITMLESKNVDIECQDHYLYPILENIYDEIEKERQQMKMKDTKVIHIFREEQLEEVIHTDQEKLKQILMSLLRNALKFTPEGHIEFGCSYAADPKISDLKFFVKDTGIGIPEEQREIIFEMFRQGDNSTKRSYGGVGIGLTLAKKLTQLLGGEIWFESKLNEGSIFYFTIPKDNRKNENHDILQFISNENDNDVFGDKENED